MQKKKSDVRVVDHASAVQRQQRPVESVDIGSLVEQVFDVVTAIVRLPIAHGSDQPVGKIVRLLCVLQDVPHL